MPLGSQQPAGGIESHPARPGQIDLGPGVQIGEIARRSWRSIQRRNIGGQLHEIPRAEAGCQPDAPQQRHQQPGRIAAAAGAAGECFLRRLHASFQANQIANALLHRPVEGHQQIDRARALGSRCAGQHATLEGVQKLIDQGAAGRQGQIGGQFCRKVWVISKRKAFRFGLQKEVEGIDRHQISHQIDRQHQLPGLFRQHQPGDMVSLWVLLPVEKMVARLDGEGIAGDERSAVGGGAQPHHMRPELHRPIKGIGRAMMQGDADRHGGTPK